MKKAKKTRLIVLDKISRVGAGMSVQQIHDYPWFKENWDKVNEACYGDNWPDIFSAMMQQLRKEGDAGVQDAFSRFMHAETVRCLANIPALRT